MLDLLLCLGLFLLAGPLAPARAGHVETYRAPLRRDRAIGQARRPASSPTISDVLSCTWIPSEPSVGELLDVDVRLPAGWTLGEVYLDRLPVRFRPEGGGRFRALAAIGRREPAGPRRLELQGIRADGQPFLAAYAIEVRPSRHPSEALTVAPSLARPSPGAWKRVYQESSARHWHTDRGGGTGPQRPWRRPTAGRITSTFGKSRILNGRPAGSHLGVDFAGRVGAPVLSPEAGRVVTLREEYLGGLTLRLDHGDGWVSHYMHLDSVAVALGDEVPRGEPLGTVGRSGRVTGPHLHWAVSWRGRYLDPLSLLEEP